MKTRVYLGLIASLIIAILVGGCQQSEDNPVNTVVRGYVYTDSTFTQPVESVFVIVRVDDASLVPDYTSYTDSTGKYDVAFYLGHTYECSFSYKYYAKVNLIFTYEGKTYMTPDYYLELGEEYDLPPVHLGLFASP